MERNELQVGQSLIFIGKYSRSEVIVLATEPWKAVVNASRWQRTTRFEKAKTRTAQGVAVAILQGANWNPGVVSIEQLRTASQIANIDRMRRQQDAERIAERTRVEEARARMKLKGDALFAALTAMGADVKVPYISQWDGQFDITEKFLDAVLALIPEQSDEAAAFLSQIGR